MQCEICCDAPSNVTCPHCSAEACTSCVKRYLMQDEVTSESCYKCQQRYPDGLVEQVLGRAGLWPSPRLRVCSNTAV